LADFNAVGDPGLWYSGSFHQLGVQALGIGVTFATVLVVSLLIFGALKYTIGIRVSAEDEDAGLDISETGMYGYPEQFIPSTDGIPSAEYAGGRPAAGTATSTPGEVTA
jgi:Amt family ammonium transporter